MKQLLRFLYLNTYSFLVVVAGILVLFFPFYKITKWTLLIQIPFALFLFKVSIDLFLSFSNKLKKVAILIRRNKNGFRPDTFKDFMQAPCSRLVVKYALKQLGMKYNYKILLQMKKPFIKKLQEGCSPVDTVIYINEDDV